jgi:predicted transglutaminase-like cysteine proteinase
LADRSAGASITTAPRDLALSPEAWKDLVRVNNWVNETIKPLTDLEHWGVVERWSYPNDGYGDCEDYVLLKRRMLSGRQWLTTCERREHPYGPTSLHLP